MQEHIFPDFSFFPEFSLITTTLKFTNFSQVSGYPA